MKKLVCCAIFITLLLGKKSIMAQSENIDFDITVGYPHYDISGSQRFAFNTDIDISHTINEYFGIDGQIGAGYIRFNGDPETHSEYYHSMSYINLAVGGRFYWIKPSAKHPLYSSFMVGVGRGKIEIYNIYDELNTQDFFWNCL